MPTPILSTGSLPSMPVTINHNYKQDYATPPKSLSPLKSRFTIDTIDAGNSSAHEVNTNTSEFHIPLASYRSSGQSWRSQEGLGNRPDDSNRSADFAVVPTRPPLRPTMSFGSMSAYSYYSSTTEDLDIKSQALAHDEEDQRKKSHGRVHATFAKWSCFQ